MKTLTLLTVAAALACPTLVSAQAAKKAPAKAPVTASAKPKSAAAKTATAPAKPAAKPQPQVAQAAPQREAAPAQAESAPRAEAKPAAAAPQKTASSAPRAAARRSGGGASLAGNKFLNVGIGVGAYGAGGLPIGASFEVGLKNALDGNLSVGGFVDYARYGYRNYGYRWNYTFIYLGARGSYHAGELLGITNDKFDPYVGVSLGYRASRYRDNDGYVGSYYNPYGSSVFFGGHLGARYLFSEKIGGFAEVGYGVAALKLGLTATL